MDIPCEIFVGGNGNETMDILQISPGVNIVSIKDIEYQRRPAPQPMMEPNQLASLMMAHQYFASNGNGNGNGNVTGYTNNTNTGYSPYGVGSLNPNNAIKNHPTPAIANGPNTIANSNSNSYSYKKPPSPGGPFVSRNGM